MKKGMMILLCFLVGVLVWRFWPEYGSGYSEEQRRLWNERRVVYPVAWRMETVFPQQKFVRASSDDRELVTGPDLKTCGRSASSGNNTAGILLKRKHLWEQELDEKLIFNRDRSGPDYSAALPLHPDVSCLPLEGLTEREVAERALAGDGDACLKMVQYLSGSMEYGGVLALSWREKREVEQWLDRAVALKRPGAVFVKNFFRKAWETQRNTLSSSNGNSLILKMDTKGIPGYDDYVECLKRGDLLLFKTLDKMYESRWVYPSQNNYPAEEVRILRNALSSEAGRGKAGARRDLAALFFESSTGCSDYYLKGRIIAEVKERAMKWNNLLQMLPDDWRECVIGGLFSCGIISADGTPSMKCFREAARYARMAARQGDMTAMYLWMKHGIGSMERFSFREWQEIFTYDRVLFESGYASYVKNINEKAKTCSLSQAVLQSFYSKKSYTSVRRTDFTMPRDRVEAWPRSEMISRDDLDEVRRKIGILRLVGRTDILLNSLAGLEFESGGILTDMPENVREYILEQVEKWVAEGDLLAIYTLAGICERGIGRSVDTDRAYSLYRQAFEGALEHPASVLAGISGMDSAGSRCVVTVNGSMKTFSALRMALMVLECPEFTGRDVGTAYSRLREAAGDALFGFRCYSVLGLFHERGIGVAADRKKAMEFYKKGHLQEDEHQKGVRRLSLLLPIDGQ